MWNCRIYRKPAGGADSAGRTCRNWNTGDMTPRVLAVRDGEHPVEVVKAKGRLKVLAEKTDNGGHLCRAAAASAIPAGPPTGSPRETNAHPHHARDDMESVVAVHNGIIENYQELKEKLLKKGYSFYSETDTEVAVKLIDYYYKKYDRNPVDAISHDHGARPRLLRSGGDVQGLSRRDLGGPEGQPHDYRAWQTGKPIWLPTCRLF